MFLSILDRPKPNVQNMISVQECKRGVNAAASWSREKLFSAMPTLEALELMMLLKTTRKKRARDWTGAIHRAFRHFSSALHPASKVVSVELPMEDTKIAQGYGRRLKRVMIGTQDASNLWQ